MNKILNITAIMFLALISAFAPLTQAQQTASNPINSLYQCLTSLEKTKGVAAVEALTCTSSDVTAATSCCKTALAAPAPSGFYVNGQLTARTVTDQEVSLYYNCVLLNGYNGKVPGTSATGATGSTGSVTATAIQTALAKGTVTGDTAVTLKAALDRYVSATSNVAFDKIFNKSVLTANASFPTPRCPDEVNAITVNMIKAARTAKVIVF